MIEFPNAKINLGLRVLQKRTDGYHDIETVFYPVPLCDILEVVDIENYLENIKSLEPIPGLSSSEFSLESGIKVRFSVSGLSVDGDLSNNLCIKACRLFDNHFGISSDIFMHLHKNIPMGAGLGGGSSDAASVLKILNRLTGNKANDTELSTLAAQLGSDCVFFINNQPSFAKGRGEQIEIIDLDLSGYKLVIVMPAQQMPTTAAFSGVVPFYAPGEVMKVIIQPIDKWQDELVNDFEKSVFEKIPETKAIKRKLLEAGAVYTAMSGSGSALFGIFNSEIPGINEFPGCFYLCEQL